MTDDLRDRIAAAVVDKLSKRRDGRVEFSPFDVADAAIAEFEKHHAIVRLPEPDEGRDDWFDATVHLVPDEPIPLSALTARALAAALLAAADVAEREQLSWHFGRSWSGHPLEDECPCPQEPCGLVDESKVDPQCDQHTGAKTMRQGHRADECGGA